MENTKFRELVAKIAALAPLCNFQIAEALSHGESVFYRRQYDQLNSEVNELMGKGVDTNLEGEDK